jgi:hypothetical protein
MKILIAAIVIAAAFLLYWAASLLMAIFVVRENHCKFLP